MTQFPVDLGYPRYDQKGACVNAKKTAFFILKLCFIVALFVLIFRPETFGFKKDLFQDITLGSILEVIREVDTGTFLFWIGFAVVVKMGGIFSGILRWKILLRGQDVYIPFWYLTKCWFMGRAIGLFLPGTLGLDGYRLVESSRYTREPIKCTTVIAVEKLIGFMALGFLVFLTLPLGMRIFDFNLVMLAAVMVILFGFIMTSFLILLNPRMVQVVVAALPTPAAIEKKINKLGSAVTAYSGHRGSLLLAVALGLCVHLGICLMYFGTASAIRAENTDLLDILFASPLVIVGSIIGPTVSGAGVREVVFGYLLGAQAGAAKAVLFGHLGLWAGEVVPFALSIPLLLFTTQPKKEELEEEAAEAAEIRRKAAEAEESIDLTPEQVAFYRGKLVNCIIGGIGGGLIAGAVFGLAETIWMTRFIEGLGDYFAFLWGPLVYGLLLSGAGLGVAAGLAFLYVLFDRFPHAAVTAGLSCAGALAAALTVFGRFRYTRDVLSDMAPTMAQNLMIVGVAVASGLALGSIVGLVAYAMREKPVRAAASLIAVFALLLAAGGIASATVKPEVKEVTFTARDGVSGPNVILIGIDTLRADYLPMYNPDAVAKTPNLDEFAMDSVVFEEPFSQASWTKPSFASIFSSLYPEAHRATAKMGQSSFLPDSVTTLAEALRDHGYYTRGFANNPNVFSIFGFDQGYVEYTDLKPSLYFGATDSASKLTVYEILRRVHGRIFKKLVITDFYQPGGAVTDKALDWLNQNNAPEGTPFFLFLHYMDPHDPFMDADQPGVGYARRDMAHPDPELKDDMIKAYNDEIMLLDRALGGLFDGLKEQGLYDNTVILLTADHGEEFLDHGGWWHGNTLYDEQIKIPFVVKLPNSEHGGTRDGNLVQSVDIAPTLIHLAGAEAPKAMQGAPLFHPAKQEAAYAYAEIDFEGNVVQAVRTLDEKLIQANVDNTRNLEPIELYNVAQDPLEQTNLAGGGNDRQAILLQTLKDKQASILKGAAAPAIATNVSSSVTEQLESLGYLE